MIESKKVDVSYNGPTNAFFHNILKIRKIRCDFFQVFVSSKKRTNKFDFTTCQLPYLEESEDTKKTFINHGLRQTWVQAQVKSNFASSSCCVFTEFEFFY